MLSTPYKPTLGWRPTTPFSCNRRHSEAAPAATLRACIAWEARKGRRHWACPETVTKPTCCVRSMESSHPVDQEVDDAKDGGQQRIRELQRHLVLETDVAPVGLGELCMRRVVFVWCQPAFHSGLKASCGMLSGLEGLDIIMHNPLDTAWRCLQPL